MTTPWTTNLCPNPSFETVVAIDDGNGGTVDVPQGTIAGYTALPNTSIDFTSQDALSGQYSMIVTTDGLYAGEGFTAPAVAFSGVNGPCSMQVALEGDTGTLLVSAITDSIGGDPMTIIGQVAVTLSPGWQTVALDDLAITDGEDVWLVVWTDSAQVLTFLVDCVQYEPESPHHPYVDDEQLYQYFFTADGGCVAEGTIELITPGLVGILNFDPGTITSDGDMSLVTAAPSGGFDDFGMWALTDPDPAMTYVGWNTANQFDGHGLYARNWGTYYPPLDYPVSDGSLLWNRAAFMAAGFQYLNVPAGIEQNLTGVQVELLPLSDILDSSPAPSAYDLPRALHVRIRPTRLNYSPNPSFETATTGWATLGGATLTRDGTIQYGILGSYDGTDFTAGSYSGRVVCANSGDAVSLVVSGLITGDEYTCSVYALPETDHITDIQIQAGGTSGGVAGVDGTNLPLTNPDGSLAWVRPSVTFTASASTMPIIFAPVTDGTFPVTFGLDANLIEEGELVGTYFDGDAGNPDYMWEGAEGVTRSYYYEDFAAGQQAVTDILARHVPIAISAANPIYNQPPTQ